MSEDAAPTLSRAQQAALDKIARGDKEQAHARFTDKGAFQKDINGAVLDYDAMIDRRPARANVGYAAVKSKGWR